MARAKRNSQALEKANIRLASIKSISATLDFGNGISVATYTAKISATKTALDDYNTALSLIDERLNLIGNLEKELKDMNEQVLISVAAKYGKNSMEYEKAGGVRKSEKKKPTSKSAN
jgi:hypothetical protein